MSSSVPHPKLATHRLGQSELEVSVVGMGCNNFGRRLDVEKTTAVVEAALDAGITFFDTADVYGDAGASETMMGEALAGRRQEFMVATKFGMEMESAVGKPGTPRGSREYIRWSIEGSLRRLQVDRIDLYQYHEHDQRTPISETLAALEELVQEGVVTAVGCSNFSAGELGEADRGARERGGIRFVTLQNEYSLLERGIEAEVTPTCERLGVSILPYLPLKSGLLSGKYLWAQEAPEGTRLAGGGLEGGAAGTDEQFDVVEALRSFAKVRGIGVIDVAIAGLAAQSAVGSVIAGTMNPEQVWANAGALRWEPSVEDLAELDWIAPTRRV
jgi:aryl-alcohol dehydrogenase-like predicted oxidoreductase